VFYGTESNRPGYDISWTNNSLWTQLGVRVYDSSSYGNTLSGGKSYWYRERGSEISLNLPVVIHRIAPETVTASYKIGARIRSFDSLKKKIVIDKKHDTSAGLFGEIYLNRNPDSAARDVVNGWGQSLYILQENSLSEIGSELPGHNTIVKISQMVPSPLKHHGLIVSLSHQNQSGLLHYDTSGTIPLGYDSDESEGGFNLQKTLTMSFEYQFPLWYADKGLGLTLLHVHLMSGSFFAEHGAGWNNDFKKSVWEKNASTSLGMTLRLNTTMVYLLPVTFGAALGYKPREDDIFVRALFGSSLSGAGLDKLKRIRTGIL
jgi:hypothetical protein